MKQLFFVVIGVLIGLVVANRVGATSGTRSGAGTFLAQVDARTKAFTGAVADGYRSREAELRTDD
ncbi:hypothetical protein BIU98_01170 [Curtobacterium sp. MMLR14_010]|uniref:hypothetical protein n=1 Tax=Curtobacterium sp. MMLR14_010 TaxID=1898743 RepID=UPI0008DD4553|nr:hypothetical protein [Curtobacterium sp. MMLR14_010]OII34630.1 hypothetical protein BIU98_01170 [Curtobacterium sp. MMLR14_010]